MIFRAKTAMKKLLLLLACLLLSTHVLAEGVYRWTDANGRVHYSDLPPPANARKVEERTMKGSKIEQDKLPFATRKAAEAFPVSLYTADPCPGCELARNYLNARKIPFTETKITTPEQQAAAAKLLDGKEVVVPFLVVGGRVHKGWLESDWATALDSAGYPARSAGK